jgi:hypothetical protein
MDRDNNHIVGNIWQRIYNKDIEQALLQFKDFHEKSKKTHQNSKKIFITKHKTSTS